MAPHLYQWAKQRWGWLCGSGGVLGNTRNPTNWGGPGKPSIVSIDVMLDCRSLCMYYNGTVFHIESPKTQGLRKYHAKKMGSILFRVVLFRVVGFGAPGGQEHF